MFKRTEIKTTIKDNIRYLRTNKCKFLIVSNYEKQYNQQRKMFCGENTVSLSGVTLKYQGSLQSHMYNFL